MYQAKNIQNHMLELSTDLNNGSLSLKDLYLDGLIVNYLSIADDDTADNNFSEDLSSKVASFTFVQNVMTKIKNGSYESSLEDLYLDNIEVDFDFELNEPFIGVSQLSPAKDNNSIDNLFNNNETNSTGTQKSFENIYNQTSSLNNGNFSSVYSKHESLNTCDSNTNTYDDKDESLNTREFSSVKTKGLKDYLYLALAFFAFALPIMFALTKVFNSSNSNSFSTLASVEQQSSIVKSSQVDLNSDYKPAPLTDGIKYVSLQVTHAPSVTDLTLSEEQAVNINIILYNFEIQKRLSE